MARRARRGRPVDGIMLLDKAAGPTSNQALQRVRRLFDASKAGHTGSLDPLATGMLPICFGEATKLSAHLLDADKTYRVSARFGARTDTGDADGNIVEHATMMPFPEGTLESLLETFVGEQWQVPPMYSALKHEGRRLYALAREGREVERAARRISVRRIELESLEWPDFVFCVHCSKGTYVRSLVADIAERAGGLGYVTALRRLAVAPFDGAAMTTEEALTKLAAEAGLAGLDRLLLPPDRALEGWPRIVLDPAQAGALRHGQRVPADAGWAPGWARLYTADSGFVGLGEVLPERELVPRRLIAAECLEHAGKYG